MSTFANLSLSPEELSREQLKNGIAAALAVFIDERYPIDERIKMTRQVAELSRLREQVAGLRKALEEIAGGFYSANVIDLPNPYTDADLAATKGKMIEWLQKHAREALSKYGDVK